jgi:hypothetical protein
MSLLPEGKTSINNKLEDQIMLVYGRPKIGKSTLCSNLDKALFLATEAGLNHLEVYKINIVNWESLLKVCAELAQGNDKFDTIVIDTVDNLVMYCSDYICKKLDVEHPGDLSHGRGWSAVTQELKRVLTKLSAMPYGLIMIGHSKQEEIETKTQKYNRFTLNIGGKNCDVIKDMSDIILFMDSEMKDGDEVGVIRTKPSLYYDAGDRSKLLPENIEYPLSDPTKAYEIIQGKFKGE